MTDPVTPPVSTATSQASAALAAGWSRLDAAGRTVFAGSLAVVVLAIVGNTVGAWSLNGLGLVLVLAGIVGAVVAWFAAAGVRAWPVAPPWLEVGAGLVAMDAALLNVLEIAFDLDQLDDRGGVLGLASGIAVLIAASAVLVAAVRRARVGTLSGWLRPRPVLLATTGAALVFVGIALQVSVGLLRFSPTMAYGMATALIAFLLVRAAGETGAIRVPVPGAWLAIGFAVASALFTLTLFGPYADNSEVLDLTDWLFLLVHVVGVVLLVGAALLASGLNLARPGSTPPGGTPPPA